MLDMHSLKDQEYSKYCNFDNPTINMLEPFSVTVTVNFLGLAELGSVPGYCLLPFPALPSCPATYDCHQ